MRELALSYGVYASFMPTEISSHEFLRTALSRLLAEKHFDEESLITVLAGNFGSTYGASYVEISTARNLLELVCRDDSQSLIGSRKLEGNTVVIELVVARTTVVTTVTLYMVLL